MSGSSYKRATKKHPARIVHVDGDVVDGFLLVPIGMDFVSKLMEAANFLPFELPDGEETYINLSSVKRVSDMADPEQEQEQSEEATSESTQSQTRDQAQGARKSAKSDARPKTATRTGEQYDALETLGLGEHASREEVQAAYRRMVKLYHPDRLRGLGQPDARRVAHTRSDLLQNVGVIGVEPRALVAT